MDETQSRDLLTVAEVAARLRVRPSTIYAAVAKYQLPHVRLWQGSKRALIRFQKADIEQFLQDQTRLPGPQDRKERKK